jgi:L-asparaginase
MDRYSNGARRAGPSLLDRRRIGGRVRGTNLSVAVLTTGGTIASRPDPSGGVVAAASGEELLEAVPEVRDRVVAVEEVFRMGSFLLAPRDMLALARRVRQVVARRDVGGVVVTHGTDTMEETAYLVDLLHGGEEPIVFTGAQRNAAEPDADGPKNLADAIRIAASPQARGLGAVVAMGGRIDAARGATKVHTTAPRAFGSPGRGQVGEVDEGGQVRVFSRLVRPTNLAGTDSLPPRVDLIKLCAGIDGALLRSALEAGAEGIVLEAFGIGNANHEILAELERAVRSGVTVLVVSRCPAGAVEPVYGNGGGYDLKEAGAIFGGDLSGQQARVLLAVALAAATERGEPLGDLIEPHFGA